MALQRPLYRSLAALVLSAVGCAACLPTSAPPPSPFASNLDQDIRLTPETPIIARHVTWTVEVGDHEPSSLELRAVATEPGRDPEELCPVALPARVRIVPDDPALLESVFVPDHCEPIALDLLASCEAGCQGGATVILYYDPAEPRETTARFVISLRGDPAMGRDGSLQLVADPRPGEDAASHIETEFIEGPMDVLPSAPNVIRTVVLHVPAPALQTSLSGLRGWMRVGIRHVDGDGRLGTDQTITVGSLDPVTQDGRTFNTEVDWLNQCQPDVDCDIVITFQTATPNASATSGEELQPDYYRWVIKASLDSLDGRELPREPFTITER